MRISFAYDYQISCPHVCNRTCHRLRCASSITHPRRIAHRFIRIAHRITLTGGESCIAFTRQVAIGFAQSKTHSQESEGCEESASGSEASARGARDRGSG